MTSDNIKSGVYLALIAGGAFIAWKAYKTTTAAAGSVGQAAAKVGGWINPASDQNLAYQGVNGVGSWFSGDKDWTLGGATYDLFHGTSATMAERYDAARVEAMADQDWTGKVANPLDPVPAGYTVDLYGFYRKKITSGGGGVFTSGATGGW